MDMVLDISEYPPKCISLKTKWWGKIGAEVGISRTQVFGFDLQCCDTLRFETEIKRKGGSYNGSIWDCGSRDVGSIPSPPTLFGCSLVI